MTQAELKSPRISHLSWGHIEVEGYPPFKDAKVFPAARGSGTGARREPTMCPCIQPDDVQELDVQELIERGAKAVVLSKGIWQRLNICPETLKVLAKNGIEVELLSASTSFVKACRLVGYSIPPAD